MTTNIERISAHSPILAAIKALGASNKRTLGFLPDGAFDQYADEGHILVAMDNARSLLGYLLFRTSRGIITITHLCVRPDMRRSGIAKDLIEELKRVTSGKMVVARCRRDYDASKFWPEVGFVARDEKCGRGRKETSLTVWQWTGDRPDLFKNVEDLSQKRLRAVMDTNILRDLYEDPARDSEETLALKADWVSAEVELAITPEIHNDLNHIWERGQRRRLRRAASSQLEIHCSDSAFKEALQAVKCLIGKDISQSADSDSDIRHLAYAVGAGEVVFVTRDKALLGLGDSFYDRFGLSVVRPRDLILRLDEILRERDYRPVRLSGSTVETVRVTEKGQLRQFASRDEKATKFAKEMNLVLSDPHTYETRVLRDSGGKHLALCVYARPEEKVLEVPWLRIAESPLASTIALAVLRDAVVKAVEEERALVRLTDTELCDVTRLALQDSGFFKCEAGWVKLCPPVVMALENLLGDPHLYKIESPAYSEALTKLVRDVGVTSQIVDSNRVLETEHKLWPAKITGGSVLNFIVPIQPRWATDLFDSKLADGRIFGAEPETLLSREKVYYRAARPHVLSAPSRILWYVSARGRTRGSMCIRAASQLVEVRTGPAKEVFHAFRRLGVYRWDDVFKDTAHGDATKEIMAFRFADTEEFKRPINWRELQSILLAETGKRSPLQSPAAITEQCFIRLYCLGMDRNK